MVSSNSLNLLHLHTSWPDNTNIILVLNCQWCFNVSFLLYKQLIWQNAFNLRVMVEMNGRGTERRSHCRAEITDSFSNRLFDGQKIISKVMFCFLSCSLIFVLSDCKLNICSIYLGKMDNYTVSLTFWSLSCSFSLFSDTFLTPFVWLSL